MDLIELADLQSVQGFPAQLEILLGQFLHSVSFSRRNHHELLELETRGPILLIQQIVRLYCIYPRSASRSPITPRTISAIEISRRALLGSPRKRMPTRAVPTAPIPTQIA